MTDIQGMRAQMRDSRGSAPRVSGGGGGVPFWIVAVVAGAVGFAIVLFAPRYFTAQRTAVLPAFQDPAHRAPPAESGQAPVPAPEQPAAMQPAQPAAPQPVQPAAQHAPAPVSRYAGKTLEEIVRTSDAVCEHRSQVVRNGGPPQRSAGKPVAEERASAHKVTAADEKLYCMLTEAPSRFCAPNQKRRATADIINYFKGIEYTNAAVQVAAKVQANAGLSKAAIDPQVVDAIEALLRAGYLTKEYREDIAANVPREIKDRFARVVGSMPNCPKPPWWSSFL